MYASSAINLRVFLFHDSLEFLPYFLQVRVVFCNPFFHQLFSLHFPPFFLLGFGGGSLTLGVLKYFPIFFSFRCFPIDLILSFFFLPASIEFLQAFRKLW